MTVLIGMAKPIPTDPDSPVLPVEIAALTPITAPLASMSGPPELPGLIAASVWMMWSIVCAFGDWMRRCSALTIPEVTVRE